MGQLIDKAAVVAEIKSYKDSFCDRNGYLEDSETNGLTYDTLCELEDSIDSLEVKEDNLLTEKQNEKVLAEIYINTFDKKFGNKLPNLKGKQLADFKNFINRCEQTFHMNYFAIHATQGKLFEKLALLWAIWGKEHLTFEVKEVDLEKEYDDFQDLVLARLVNRNAGIRIAKHFFELGLKAKGE